MIFFIFIIIPNIFGLYTVDNIDKHQNWNAHDADVCGVPSSFRIIGGEEAVLGEFPFIARLGYVSTGFDGAVYYDYLSYLCGGSLIANQYVISAAHCFTKPTIELYSVRLGENFIVDTNDCDDNICADPVQDIRVDKVYKHEHYNTNGTAQNDIALIKLKNPAIYSSWVQPICLPHGNYFTNSFVGNKVEIAGWGYINKNNSKYPNVLQKVMLMIQNNLNCFNCFKKSMIYKQFCAGDEKKDTCNGDSGGPVMINGPKYETSKIYLFGIVSYGEIHCGIGVPSVNTRVSEYLEWILDHMEIE